MIGQREINISYKNIRQIHCGKKGIYIDGGNSHDSVLLRFMRDKDEAYRVIIRLMESETEDNYVLQKKDNSLLLSQYRA